MTTIWDEIDNREARYKAECASTLEQIKKLIEARFPATCSECGRPHDPVGGHDQFDNPVGEITCGQDEFGWWRSVVKVEVGHHLSGEIVWRDLTYQARSSEGLVLAVRERKEAA